MKYLKTKLILIGILMLIIIGAITGRIRLQWGDVSVPKPGAIEEDVVAHMQNLENVTGQILIFPGAYDRFINALGQTTQVLQIETYEFTEKRVKDLFQNLLNKKVNIQLILENHPYQSYTDSFDTVRNMFSGYSNFAIKSDQQMKTEFVHSKVDIMDESFLIKSANLTHSSLFSNREYMFYSTNSGVLQSLKTIFAKDRAGERIELADLHPNLVVCNINCRYVIENILKNAKQSIIIETQYINDASIMDILTNRQKLPEMKLLVADITTNDMLQSYLPDFTKKYTKSYLHAKMILVDHKLLLLGSMNLSSNALDKNREIGILLTDPALINGFTTQFTTDWNNTK